jgi:dihydroneopterin triphosphate diphosphatase
MRVRHDMVTCYAVRASGLSHEFLQLRRVPDDFMGGTWQAVSGGIEAGETAWAAAIRELREEAGLSPVEFYRLPIVNTFYIAANDTLWHAVPFCAIVDPAAVVVLNSEHDAVRWVPRERAAEAFMWATDRAAIVELCRTILDGTEAKAYLRIREI